VCSWHSHSVPALISKAKLVIDKALIAEAAEALRLRTIVVYESSLKRFAEIPEKSGLGIRNKLSVRGEKATGIEAGRELKILRVHVDLGVRVVTPAQPGGEPTPLFQIEADFLVDYELTAEVPDTALQEFARYNAVHNAWPFWRQVVFNTANQANLPCPEIPLRTKCMNLAKLH
jgi:hypothetical protein